MAAMGAAQANVNSGNSSRNESFFSYTSLPDTVKRDSIKTYTPEYAYYVKDGILEKRKIKSKNSYASGTRNAKGGLRVVNEEGAELTLEKLPSGNYAIGNEGDQILTKEQTDNIFEWSQVLPDDFMERILKMAPTLLSWDIPNFSAAQQNLIPESRGQRSDINVHYDKLIEINGDVNDADRIVNKMETVAEKAIKKSWHDVNMTMKYGIY